MQLLGLNAGFFCNCENPKQINITVINHLCRFEMRTFNIPTQNNPILMSTGLEGSVVRGTVTR